MSLADPTMPLSRARSESPAIARDPRLDFFRGIAMFIILIAHTPGNWATLWIPARFGFSDATEMFVFLSGMASAIAFGKVFRERGMVLGTARVGFRCWQVYWAHIGLFFAVAATMAALNATELFERDYVGQLNLYPFFNRPLEQLPALLTLTYVPNYFDILPMYLVILALMPVVVGLVQVHKALAVIFCLGLWLLAQERLFEMVGLSTPLFELPAEPWSDREWFFNPFGWQLVFFTGFAFMAGWLPKPPAKAWLIALAIAVVLVNVILSNIGARFFGRGWLGFGTEDANFANQTMRMLLGLEAGEGNPINAWRRENAAWIGKTDFGLFRYLHFLSLAYLFWLAAGDGGKRLLALGRGIGAYVMPIIMKVGQQSLTVFITSMFTARLMGWALDQMGRDLGTMWLVNLAGFAVLIVIAYSVGWIKSQPWRAKRGAAK